MKKRLKSAVFVMLMAIVLTGCVSRPKIPDEWYKETLKYYSDGFAGGWKNERSDMYVSDEMKDSNNKFGYLLRDLDGDGNYEVLIGIIDDSNETRFIDLLIWHNDFGALRSFHTGDGYYIYLCENNIIRMDSWYGSKTQTQYMKYDPEDNSFPCINETGTPLKFDLTAF